MLDFFCNQPKSKNWRFTYVGGGDRKPSDSTPQKTLEYLVLNDVSIGESIKIICYTNRASSLHLRKLGLNPGVSIQLLSRSASGSVIISLNNRPIGIGADLAAQLIVSCLFEGSCGIDNQRNQVSR